jgi:1-deoxy-D-xylulose-5-phosphate reductoisomerase
MTPPLVTQRYISILGSTGSVGVSTLDLLGRAVATGAASVRVKCLVAGQNVALLAQQALQWRPELTVVADESRYGELAERLQGSGLATATGADAVIQAGVGADWVMAAIVGAAGLRPTLAAARSGAIIALANKESLVCAGPALLAAAKAAGGKVVPVDSEHSAIFQVLQPDCLSRVRRLILTASGGPFRTWTQEAMARATPSQAVAHPNWNMGAKISVDSATMMNKGLEMIEASYLFDTPESKIDVLVHPQSVVHSLVEYEDGSTLAQLGPPDMRAPIACAFAWPDRLPWPAPPLDLAKIGSLTFEAPDPERFPALALARTAMRKGGGAPAALNAANEVAVAAFLAGRTGFLEIARCVAETLERMDGNGELHSKGDEPVEAAFAVDGIARRRAAEVLSRLEPVT